MRQVQNKSRVSTFCEEGDFISRSRTVYGLLFVISGFATGIRRYPLTSLLGKLYCSSVQVLLPGSCSTPETFNIPTPGTYPSLPVSSLIPVRPYCTCDASTCFSSYLYKAVSGKLKDHFPFPILNTKESRLTCSLPKSHSSFQLSGPFIIFKSAMSPPVQSTSRTANQLKQG